MKKKTVKESVFTKLSYVFIALMLTVFLFYFNSTGYSGITEAKLPVFRALCGGYVILNIILIPACLATGLIKTDDIKRKISELTAAQKLAAVFMLLTVLSSLLSDFSPRTWQGVSRYEGTITVCTYCLCFIFLSSFGRIKKWMPYLLGASVLVFCALCIVQLCGKNPFSLYPEGMNFYDAGTEYNGQYLGTIGNADLTAAFFCIVIPLLSAAVIRMKGKTRFLLLVPIAASLFVLLKMSVLAGLLGVFAGMVLSLPVLLPLSDKRAKWLMLLIAVLLLLCVLLVFFVDSDVGMLHEAHELLHGRADESFGSGRMYIWKNVLERVPEHLMFGSGPDTMILSGIEPFTRFDADKNVNITAEIDTAHNEYLNILFHQGVFALLAYLALLVVLAVKWIRRGRASDAAAAAGTAVLCYCIQAFFGISMFLTAPFYWMTLGLLDSSLRIT